MTAEEAAREALRIDALYRDKARAEIAAAEDGAPAAGNVRGQGDVLAEVLLVKGVPGPHERRSKRALSGEGGAAIGKALDALGLPKARFAFVTQSPGSRRASLQRIRLLTEAIDPRFVVLLDPAAAHDFAEAFGIPPAAAGELVTVGGRAVVSTDDFAASLANESDKLRVWRQLKALSAVAENETDAS